MKTLLLIDGSSYLYRAFHAMPDLRSPEGMPTGAIYGVLNMLRRIHQDYSCDYSACVFDAKGKTFRDEWYADYKATRPPMPGDLAAQIEPLHEAIRAMGWPIIIEPGVEADDVIGTLAMQAANAGMRVIISTGDKDMAQLVGPNVSLINTMTNEKLDEAGVQKKFGVPANRIVDFLTLVGDKVDNVPGVEKCGEKTAVKWLTEFDSLDNLMAHSDAIKGVVGENLRQARDWLPMGRKLVTIRCDVPLPEAPEQLGHLPQDIEKLKELFSRFGFKSWLRELSAQNVQGAAVPEQPQAPAVSAHYETLLTEADLGRWIDKLNAAPLICLDTETTSLDAMQAELVGMSFAVNAHEAAYLPLKHVYAGAPDQLNREQVLARLKPLLENAGKPKLGQNLKYDMHILANYGITLRGVVHDTLLESAVLESHKPHDMDSMADRHLGYKTVTFTEVCGKGAKQICFDQVDLETATRYAAEDADITLQLHEALHPEIARDEKLAQVYGRIEMPLVEVLWRMERNGVLLDTAELNAQSHELGRKMLAIEQQVYDLAGQPFNLNSPKQICEILFDKLQLPVKKKTPSGAPSTDEEVLAQLAEDFPLPKLLLEYRGLAKLKSTYTDKLPRMVDPTTGRVHTSYHQAGAVTGRLASSDPNLQNIPVRTTEGRRIREAFIARPGSHIVAADYSQIELRIMAHLSSDAALLKAFAEGRDVHRATAAEIFGQAVDEVSSDQRRIAKSINFGLIYGMSSFGLASQLGIERYAAQNYIDRYFQRYPGVRQYMEQTRAAAHDNGYVETVFGRRLWLQDINASGPRRQGAERAAINAPMQGTAADIVKLAMINVQRWLEANQMQSQLIMQVHDELVLEVPEAELEQVRHQLPVLMAEVAQLQVPLVVEVGVGSNWEKAH
jgi:DNA polymerase I